MRFLNKSVGRLGICSLSYPSLSLHKSIPMFASLHIVNYKFKIPRYQQLTYSGHWGSVLQCPFYWPHCLPITFCIMIRVHLSLYISIIPTIPWEWMRFSWETVSGHGKRPWTITWYELVRLGVWILKYWYVILSVCKMLRAHIKQMRASDYPP